MTNTKDAKHVLEKWGNKKKKKTDFPPPLDIHCQICIKMIIKYTGTLVRWRADKTLMGLTGIY